MTRTSLRRAALGAALSALLLVGCDTPAPIDQGNDTTSAETVSLDALAPAAASLADYMLGATRFDDALVPLEGDIAGRLYGVDTLAEDIAAYGSTGATAEAVLVLRAASVEDALAATAKIAKYRDEMAAVYADYNMPESEKLKNALLLTEGRYVLFCVSPDTAAATETYQAFLAAPTN